MRRIELINEIPSRRLDGALAALFFVFSSALSVSILSLAGTLFFYQNFSPEVVYAGCGLGFQHPGTIPESLQRFLLVQQGSFDCNLLDPTTPLQSAGFFARLQLYLSYSVAFLWSPPTLRYWDLWPLVAIFGGAYGAGLFVLFRLFLPRLVSVLGALLASLSPIALTLMLSFRDYSKAPFFIWALYFLISAMRADAKRTASWYALGAGIAVGLGFGFRADLIIIVPFGILALLAATTWRDLSVRIPAIAVFATISILVSWPAASLGSGSSAGSILIQGMSEPFQNFLGLKRTQYNLGTRYSDELVLSSIAAAERPKMPDWDKNESTALYGISQSMKLSGQNAQKWMHLFVGDLSTQGIKSLAWLTAMPALFAAGRPADLSFGAILVSAATTPGKYIFAILGNAWLLPIGIAGAIAFCLREVALRPRYFLGTAILIGLLAASSAAQFAVRHIFHLEFIWILSVLSLGVAVSNYRTLRSAIRPVAIGIIALTVLGGATYAAALSYQQSALKAAIAYVLSLPRENIYVSDMNTEPHVGPSLTIDIPVPSKHASIVKSPDDSMNKNIPLIGLQWDVRAEADRLILSLVDCPKQNYAISLEYQKSPSTWQAFDEAVSIDLEPHGTTSLLMSAFYRPTQYLSKLIIKPQPKDCTVRLERLDGDSPLPYLFTAILPPNWEQIRWYRSFGGFGAISP